ncbi:MAG: HAMP domain-containing histidine kinase [Candidatus Peribacteraceae bacterium]|nr:HAMP domain-containing histidine kinase [Candidatus Peribacteraceae bacterium]
MFKRISFRIALQFTAFVLGLFLLNGIIFLAADISNARRQTHFRLSRESFDLLRQIDDPRFPVLRPGELSPKMRERVRFLNASGKTLYTGSFLADVPFTPHDGFTRVRMDEDEFMLLTVPVIRRGEIKAYAQIADMERLPLGDLPVRALLYLIVSLSVSALTFIVGLAFARRSLRPAEDMMRRLEQFTQDASHELRTPLAALNSSLDLALKTGKHQHGLLSAKDDVKDITILIERLLELARIDKFALEDKKFDFSALVSDTLEKYRIIAHEKNVGIKAAIQSGVWVRGDAALLRQVLSNLLLNAVKFNQPSGSVKISLTHKELTVSDTGIGIAKKDLPNIFNRFFQADTSRAKEGFGLGLALVKRIIELHGWAIRAESDLGKGTTFRIAFSASQVRGYRE